MDSTLSLKKIKLPTRLGCGDEERALPQVVMADLEVKFHAPPTACQTDELSDAICYAKLSEKMKELCMSRPFHLIEKLAFDLFELIKKEVPSDATVTLTVCKNPPLTSVGASCFMIGD